jgi:hypothetical protein
VTDDPPIKNMIELNPLVKATIGRRHVRKPPSWSAPETRKKLRRGAFIRARTGSNSLVDDSGAKLDGRGGEHPVRALPAEAIIRLNEREARLPHLHPSEQ